MTECAERFLAALDNNQRGRTTFSFDSDERLNWHFIPRERKGLSLREMTPYQKQLASALLAAGLSQAGYIKAVTIMSLEDVLRIIEHTSGEYRNPEKYYFSVFGTPDEKGMWGYRVEGHHFSQNYTIVNGKVIDAPSFFGAHPAQVEEGPRKGLRTLAGESSGKGPGPESSILKIKGTEIQQRLQELALEAVGHYGAPFLRDLGHNAGVGPAYAEGLAGDMFNGRKTSIYGGSNEIQRNIIAKMVLGL